MTTINDWKILVIDDDSEFYDWASSVLEHYTIEKRNLTLIYSTVQDMVAKIREQQELNVIVLKLTTKNRLMCLEVVRYVRRELKNQTTRVILLYDRVKALPDENFFNQYDICEVRTKKGLTPVRWRILARNVLKNYISKQREAILDSVFQVSQYEKGGSYIQSMVSNLAKNLGLRYTFIGMVDEGHSIIKTTAAWGNGRMLENFEYPLENTPCEQVLTGNRVCIHSQGVREAYPEDKLLQDMGMDSYMGCPILLPSGKLLGLLAALDDKPMKETGVHRPIMEFFAERAGVEFERALHAERMQKLNTELETKVKKRTEELNKTHETMLELAHKAGMAEIASGVLHNIGNVLNSIITSSDLLDELLATSELKTLSMANDLIGQHKDDLETFFTQHPKGKLLPHFFRTVEGVLKGEQEAVKKENEIIKSNAAVINQVIKTQQEYAGKDSILIRKNLADIMDHTLEMMGSALTRHNIRVVKKYQELPMLPVHKTRLVQVLTNLVKNAREAMMNQNPDNRILEIDLFRTDHGTQCLTVKDNGSGVKAEHMAKLFNFGFTTKAKGNGFGLHSSINFVRQIGGQLTASSEGRGKGAVFTLELPENEEKLSAMDPNGPQNKEDEGRLSQVQSS